MTEFTNLDILYEDESVAHAKMIWSSIEKRATSEEAVEVAGSWTSPDEWHEFRWKRLPRGAVQPFDEDERHGQKSVPDAPHVAIRYDPDPFREAIEAGDETELAQTAIDLIDLVEYTYAAAECPRFVYGVSELHESRLEADELPPPVTRESLAENRIEYATWLMAFPREMADSYGHDCLLSAPAWQTVDIGDGGVIVLTTENPTNPSRPETRATDQHLDLDPPSATEEYRY